MTTSTTIRLDEEQMTQLLGELRRLHQGGIDPSGTEAVTMALIGGNPRTTPSVTAHLDDLQGRIVELRMPLERIADCLEAIVKLMRK